MDATMLQRYLSKQTMALKRSEIRELLKLISKPEVISLAGGLPSPETFPIESLAQLIPDALRKHGTSGLQYGATEGDKGLRQELIAMLEADGLHGVTLDRLLVTSASQQALDLVGRTFVAPGDAVVVGLPSYLGALGAFTACGASLTGVPLDDDGMPPDLLEEHLVELRKAGVRPKLLYLVPDFQNPDGSALPLGRRLDLLAIAREFDLLVLEDSPYRQLRYEGETVPSMASLDRDERVIGLYTFSKILSPGLRLGWVVANPAIINQMVTVRQAMDLCTSPFTQMIAREFLKTGQLPALVEQTRQLYARKRLALLDALAEHIDPAWGVRWTKPQGGMFLWVTLPPHLRSPDLLHLALQENVAFVVGTAFHCDGGGQNSLRLNFSYPSVDQLRVGVQRLARAIAALVAQTPAPVESAAQPIPAHVLVAGSEHALANLSWNLALTEVVA